MTPLLQLEQISKHLGSFHLNEISLELPPGYIMGLIGPNGAGKTTLLHLILGLYAPEQGTLLVDGMDYAVQEREIREEIGTVLLEELFSPRMSLRQNADYYGAYYKNYDADVFEMYLRRFSVVSDKKYRELSCGEELKFQLAFALSHAPKLLLLDEPAGNFDPEFRREFFAVLREFVADGTRSVLLSTHLTGDLERMADYITYLEKGTCLLSEDIETLRESYRLLTGEAYKIRLIPKERVVHVEEGEFGTRALVRHHRRDIYDGALTVTEPTIEEFMYFMTKRRRGMR